MMVSLVRSRFVLVRLVYTMASRRQRRQVPKEIQGRLPQLYIVSKTSMRRIESINTGLGKINPNRRQPLDLHLGRPVPHTLVVKLDLSRPRTVAITICLDNQIHG